MTVVLKKRHTVHTVCTCNMYFTFILYIRYNKRFKAATISCLYTMDSIKCVM